MKIRDGESAIIRRRVDLRECGGVASLARMTARHALAALAVGVGNYYAWPGGIAVARPGEALVGESRRRWAEWRDWLRSQLGGAVMRRSLRATGEDPHEQLAWRGLLVVAGLPVAWQTWTPGERHHRHGPGAPLTLEDLETIAGPVRDCNNTTGKNDLPPGNGPSWAPRTLDFDTATAPLGEARLPILARGSDRIAGHSRIDRTALGRASRHVWEIDQDNVDAYIVMRGSLGRVRLHEYIMGGEAGEGRSWDHVSRDRWDNRRSYLVARTPAEQADNRGVRSDSLTRVKGVRLRKDGRYEARMRLGGERVTLGYYATEGEARAAYAAAAAGRRLPVTVV